MRKIVILFVLIIGIGNCGCFAKTKNKNLFVYDNLPESLVDSLVDYPVMHSLITSYCYYYLEYPDNILDLVRYVQDTQTGSQNNEDTWDYFAHLLLSVHDMYGELFTMTREEDIFSFTLRGDILSQMRISIFGYNPCDIKSLIGEHPSDYVTLRHRFDIFRYYDQQHKAVINPAELQEKLNEKIRELQVNYLVPNQYKTFTYEDFTYPVYIVLEYRLPDGLKLFCENKSFNTDVEYFKKLEDYLTWFCKEHALSRIVFLSPEYQ